jgi:hypothetical protein
MSAATRRPFALRTSLAAAGLLATAGLAGCQYGYGVDLRNQTNAPLQATLTATDWTGTTVLEQRYVGPGDRRAIGPHSVASGKTVILAVDTKDNPTGAQQMTLGRGSTSVVVTRQAGGEHGPLKLDPLPPN